MKKLAYVIILSASIALSAFVSSAPVEIKSNISSEISAAKATTYSVNQAASELKWLAKKVTGEHYGNIKVSNGTLSIENNALKGGNFELDTKSITVTDLADAGSNEKLTNHLKGEDFFAVDKFPKANFVISSVKPIAGNQYDVAGKLTIKGITNDVTFPATVDVKDKKLTAVAKISVDRTKYNIKFRSSNFFENLGDKAIADNFDLDIKLVANAQ